MSDSAFNRQLNEMGGPGRVIAAGIIGLMDRQISKSAKSFFGKLSRMIPDGHPLKSSFTEAVAGVTQAISELKYTGPAADLVHRWLDYGQRDFFNGDHSVSDWMNDFEAFAHREIQSAENIDGALEHVRRIGEAHINLSKMLSEFKSQVEPEKSAHPIGDAWAKFDDQAGGVMESFLDWLEAGRPPGGPKPPKSRL